MERAVFIARFFCCFALCAGSLTNGIANNTGRAIADDPLTKCTAFGENGRETIGVCGSVQKHIYDCPPLYKIYKSKQFLLLRNHFCSPRGSPVAKICCDISQYVGAPKQKPEPWYWEHKNFRLFPHENCGKNELAFMVGDRIIGGNNAAPGQFPWMARVGFKDGKKKTFPCGGSIINKRYILTAAHCFNNFNPMWKKVVRLGEYNVTHNEAECITSNGVGGFKLACGKAEDYEVEEVIIHPGYTYDEENHGAANDIALIRLKREIDLLSYFTKPICLPFVKEYGLGEKLDDRYLIRRNLKWNEKLQVAGWGLVHHEDPNGSNVLKFVALPFKPLVACEFVYRDNILTKEMLCVGGAKGADSCLGDSGSPLMESVVVGPDALQFQVGIVSFGRTHCGLGGSPVIYTRVRNYLSWVLDTVRE